MKTTTYILTLIFSTLFLSAFAQQAEKTLVKTFNLMGNDLIFLDVDGAVQLEKWNEPHMRIQMTITLQNGNETILKSLVTAGRYNLDLKSDNGKASIVAPGLEKQIKLSSGDLGEDISFIVYAPQDVRVKTRSDEATGFVDTDSE